MSIPFRGEIWFVNLNPATGYEKQGLRPVLWWSRKRNTTAFVRRQLPCPITQGGQQSRFAGFAVTLMGTGAETQGVVMCNKPRTIGMVARGARFVEAVSDDLLDEVMSHLQPIFE